MADWSLRKLIANELQSAAHSAHMSAVVETTAACTPERRTALRRADELLDQDWLSQADSLINIINERFEGTLDPMAMDRDEPTRKFAREVLGEPDAIHHDVPKGD